MFYIVVFSSWDDMRLWVEVTGDMAFCLQNAQGGKLVYYEDVPTADRALERKAQLVAGGDSRMRQLVQRANPFWKVISGIWNRKDWRTLVKKSGYIPGEG